MPIVSEKNIVLYNASLILKVLEKKNTMKRQIVFGFILVFILTGCIAPSSGLEITPQNFTTPEIAQTTGDSAEETPTAPKLDWEDLPINQNAFVETGDTVWVDYVGLYEDTQEVFDTSIREEAVKAGLPLRSSYEPLEVTVGSGQVIQGFDEGLMGLEANDFFVTVIPPEKGYGPINPDLIQTISWTQFNAKPEDYEIGQEIQTSQGTAKIVEKTNETVTLDFNHKLAGKTLVFRLTVQRIVKSSS